MTFEYPAEVVHRRVKEREEMQRHIAELVSENSLLQKRLDNWLAFADYINSLEVCPFCHFDIKDGEPAHSKHCKFNLTGNTHFNLRAEFTKCDQEKEQSAEE